MDCKIDNEDFSKIPSKTTKQKVEEDDVKEEEDVREEGSRKNSEKNEELMKPKETVIGEEAQQQKSAHQDEKSKGPKAEQEEMDEEEEDEEEEDDEEEFMSMSEWFRLCGTVKNDVNVRIGDVIFECDMMTLQRYSEHFMKYYNEIEIQLPKSKVTTRAFDKAYEWMLLKNVQIPYESIAEVLSAANFLLIDELAKQCWDTLNSSDVCENIAFTIYLAAKQFGSEYLERLMTMMLVRISRYFLTLVSTEAFLKLNVNEMCTLLSSDEIAVNSEEEVFLSVVLWISENRTISEAGMLRVIKCVRFGLMPRNRLANYRTCNVLKIADEIEWIICHPEVINMISDGILYCNIKSAYRQNKKMFDRKLQEYKLSVPKYRRWTSDAACVYHRRLRNPNWRNITYSAFLAYLKVLRVQQSGVPE